MIPKDTIDHIYSTAKIEEVVSDYVTLKRRGANMIGLCPFHNERTPSFSVSPAKGIYKCFGCGKAGNAIGFVMEAEQCSYTEAVKQIAKKYHIEIQERELTAEEQQRQDDRESMFVINEYSNKWFQEQLWNTDEGKSIGISYFRERGLQDNTIRKFQLGYAPETGNRLAAALKKEGFEDKYIYNNPETQIGTGLCGKHEGSTQPYDRFRGRVIFPIHTVSGKTVAFAGRILKTKENTGKYVNSPDSVIYSKTNELYGLFLAKQAIARADLCYLVEGQMDVISMSQAGIENVVASGGTALTKPQIRLIHRFTSNITVLYDGDAAGIHAALRGIDMFLEEGFNVKVLLLPDGEDPDSFSKKHNASDFINYIETHQTDFIRFKTTLLSKEAGSDPQKRSELIKDVVGTIAKIPDSITRQVYTKDSADQLSIKEELLTREVARLHIEKRNGQETAAEKTDTPASNTNVDVDLSRKDPYTQKLNENYINLLRIIIRYGEKPLYPLEDGTYITAGEYIISQLDADCIEPPTALYGKIISEFQAHIGDEGFKAETFFKFHEDSVISAFAIEQIVDKYQLSRIFLKQSISENVVTQVKNPTDEDNLTELVPKLLLEIKYTIINQRIDNLEKALRDAQERNDWQLTAELLKGQPQLLEIKNIIGKQLGNRIITL